MLRARWPHSVTAHRPLIRAGMPRAQFWAISKAIGLLTALLSLAHPSQSLHEASEPPYVDALVVQDGPLFGSSLDFAVNSTTADFGTLSHSEEVPVDGYTKLADITIDGSKWTVFEDLRQRDGNIVFRADNGQERVFPKYAEASFWPASPKYPKYLGMSMRDIGMDPRDLLADELLKDGEPNEEKVAGIIPPSGSAAQRTSGAASWTSFVGNVHAIDTMPVFGYGSTRTYHPNQKFPGIQNTKQRWDGNVGGWLPAVRKILPIGQNDYHEIIVFGDDSPDQFIVQHWVRAARITDGKVTKVVYANSYPEFRPTKLNPKPEEFYVALFKFGAYWEHHVQDLTPITLPDSSWSNLAKYAFVKELMVRPFGTYPKYGAVDRDYYGSEYDGFQDIFTSSLATSLEWGNFRFAGAVIDNYFSQFVAPNGAVNMRGPEVSQFAMSLSLLTKYAKYTGNMTLLEKYKSKIVATANSLIELHDEALALPRTNPGHGLIHGWSESDAALILDPDVYWKPYFANSAFSARGLRDISSLPLFAEQATVWLQRSQQLAQRTAESMKASVLTDRNPPYMPPLPGTNKTFRESMATDKPSYQDWPHRLYAELLHAAVLPADLANHVHDTMRAYGATSLGVVANVGRPSPGGRDILGFISYGHAYSLLLLDRTDEFVLFLYSHRYHAHSRGAWNALEVAPINGVGGTFCIPAQLTIPNILRWALVLEHPDEDIVYFGRGVPRAWIATGKEISVKGAPTRFGRVDYSIQLNKASNKIKARIKFERDPPKQVEIKLRGPNGSKVSSATVNGQSVSYQKNEAVLVEGAKELLVEAALS
jgi:hypothetical protein